MATKNSIKVIKTTTTVEVNDTDHLLTIEPEKSVTLELANTEGFTAEAKWLAEGNIKADDNGLYLDSTWSFQGLAFKGEAELSAKAIMEKDDNGDQDTYTIGDKATLTFQAIAKQDTIPLGKWYFNKK
ncbi:hypothetical protein [Psychroserpens sp. NJDZ02]|uniref:hypothetical protein n=1 Tax=Psychroserpens sp. NJDZ02 TaxID=2570561 RepID=UPI0010A7CD7D|nr:hypothetical protein [Psychroserpens sp. NJDZ02]QCE43120.1 hypothetical protein E9099_17405 [Psychroserpens sp. NJDZ02]